MYLKRRPAVFDRGTESAVTILTALGARELLERVDAEAWAQRVTGSSATVAGLVVSLAAFLVAFLLWGALFRAAYRLDDFFHPTPVALLEIAIVAVTATVTALFLYDGVRRPALMLMGIGVSVLVWVPWLHLRAGKPYRPQRPTSSDGVDGLAQDHETPDAEALASAVAAVLVGRGHPARLVPDGDQAAAMVVLDGEPGWGFEVAPQENERPWSAVQVGANGEQTHYAGSPLDLLRKGATPEDVAEMIMAHVAEEREP